MHGLALIASYPGSTASVYGGYDMNRYMILSALVVAAALSVSGCCCCSGLPGGDVDIGIPTSLPGNNDDDYDYDDDDPLSTRSLFDNSNLNYYEWRWTSTSEGETNTFNYRVERGTEDFKGVDTKYKKSPSLTTTGTRTP
ncbi:hypothetical protein RCIX1218 [Methanocella arvoryzae MRE50]|uniref:Uncharacterized protein n=2 Tax=Methanocella TaxID=570266 RepID=Q0W520_METAR|nr:hypothetical protein RCIX1218 [Methanocella arvoryzae MRE50]